MMLTLDQLKEKSIIELKAMKSDCQDTIAINQQNVQFLVSLINQKQQEAQKSEQKQEG